ncbi:MAG: rhodanese-like domain-containing protein [Candidatus Paceibacterota bacterium]
MKSRASLVCIALISGALAGAGVVVFFQILQGEKSDSKAYYRGEVAANVSPHELEEMLVSGEDVIVVDLRDSGSYGAGHVLSALNITGSEEEVLEQFRNLPKEKMVITYCYNDHCMLSRKVGDLLAQHGIYVKHLTAGFEELEAGAISNEYIFKDSDAPGGSCELNGIGC